MKTTFGSERVAFDIFDLGGLLLMSIRMLLFVSSEANQMYTAYQPQTSNNQVRRAGKFFNPMLSADRSGIVGKLLELK